MADIDLYDSSASHYAELQNKRPDYVGAQEAFIELAVKYLGNTTNLFVADFCCGIGSDTKSLAEKISIVKAVLVDVNADFLKIANESKMNVKDVITIQSDILEVRWQDKFDAVISMFAYHHVQDGDKNLYIGKVKDALKSGGLLILGEIYAPDQATILRYYEHLLENIPASVRTLELERFLTQTARSEHFEYKVPREFAHEQLIQNGFQLVEDRKIWPLDGTFATEVGTFVEIWKKA